MGSFCLFEYCIELFVDTRWCQGKVSKLVANTAPYTQQNRIFPCIIICNQSKHVFPCCREVIRPRIKSCFLDSCRCDDRIPLFDLCLCACSFRFRRDAIALPCSGESKKVTICCYFPLPFLTRSSLRDECLKTCLPCSITREACMQNMR